MSIIIKGEQQRFCHISGKLGKDLKEYINGEVTHTKIPKQRKPVEEYLKLQGRFKHLFEPQRDEQTIAEIQTRVDAYWDKVERRGDID